RAVPWRQGAWWPPPDSSTSGPVDAAPQTGGHMVGTALASVGESFSFTTGDVTTVVVVALIALGALGVAAVLVREVLAASEGTDRMKEIAAAIQEGASAYLNRQFRTLSIFAVLVFFLLFLLPADTTSVRVGRSLFFLVGAVFSATTGYTGMWLAVRGN